MIYIKGQLNTLIVNKARAYVVPQSQRVWQLEFYHMNTNTTLTHVVPDISPYPDSFLRFDLDDNVYNLNEGLHKLNVYEKDSSNSNTYLFSEQIIRVIVQKSITEYDGEKTYVVYG